MDNIREKIIQNYIDGYNEFDIEKMVRDLDDEIVFQNIQDKEMNMTLNGINAFKQQAEQAKSYFENRQQRITSTKHIDDKTEIEIEYSAVLGMDFPNGLKKGQQLEIKGKSIFVFKDNKISELTDIS
ncbi:nuclear transport factor 2 family protein [Flavobacterium sp. I-SCBP12n]|uniref:Nuclear transport factor 2 family protein n=1 Tax=Flavobacterium pygoscelis TaxID=2893176 RepID=A0A9X1XWZ1_9FLAO|nr:nuclear transport factor 2 family protein [Flavobacterium pygoscelis]MCK8143311.1 nuclear transport factor 2 family protein [Flavobacterium pygoscelis]